MPNCIRAFECASNFRQLLLGVLQRFSRNAVVVDAASFLRPIFRKHLIHISDFTPFDSNESWEAVLSTSYVDMCSNAGYDVELLHVLRGDIAYIGTGQDILCRLRRDGLLRNCKTAFSENLEVFIKIGSIEIQHGASLYRTRNAK